MYLVKLDLSVHGVPASVTRGLERHFELHVESDTPLGAIKKAQDPVFSPELTTPVSDMLTCVRSYVVSNFPVLPWSCKPVVSARFTLFEYSVCGHRLDKIYKVATYVRDFAITYEID